MTALFPTDDRQMAIAGKNDVFLAYQPDETADEFTVTARYALDVGPLRERRCRSWWRNGWSLW